MGDEVWICSSCRSVNTRRSGQCYSCHAWRTAVAVAPADVGSLGSVLSTTSAAPAPAGHRYRSAWLRALVASLLIVAVAIMLPVQWWYSSLALRAVAHGDEDVAKAILDQWIPLRLLFVGLIVAAFVGWAAWLSRVVDNLPALGIGYSRASPRMAFIESVVPVFNLFRLPARVREVTRLLHPQGGGDGLIAFAWLVLFGTWVIPILGVRLLTYWAIMEGDFASNYTAYVVLLGIALGGTAIGLLMVVVVIRRVESLAAARVRALVPAAAAPPSGPAAPTARPGRGDTRRIRVVARTVPAGAAGRRDAGRRGDLGASSGRAA